MSGHVVPFPQPCMWCGQPATQDTTCPATIHCPHCGAKPGERCRQPNGHACDLHAERRTAALRSDGDLPPEPSWTGVSRTVAPDGDDREAW